MKISKTESDYRALGKRKEFLKKFGRTIPIPMLDGTPLIEQIYDWHLREMAKVVAKAKRKARQQELMVLKEHIIQQIYGKTINTKSLLEYIDTSYDVLDGQNQITALNN